MHIQTSGMIEVEEEVELRAAEHKKVFLSGIPEHWEVKKLKEVCKAVTGATPPKNDPSNYGSDIPFVKPPQVIDAPIFDAPEKLSVRGGKNGRVLPAGAVLVTCIGNLGRTAINKVPVAFNQQINALLPSDGLDSNFLFYHAQSLRFKRQLESLSSATTVAIVNKGKFETIEIVIPPLSEQQVIIAKIEELFSALDKGKQQLEEVRQQLKVYRQAVLKWAFEGKLTNGTVYEGKLPEGWKWVKLGEISESCLGKMLDKQKNTGTLKPYLGNINVRWGHFNLENLSEMRFEESESERFGILEGDLIICEGGEPGRAAIWKARVTEMKIQKALHRVRFENPITGEYFLYYLNLMAATKSLEKYFTGTTIKHLTGQSLRKVELPLAPLEEQKRVVQEIESRLSVCDKMEETIEQSLLQAETLRQSILKRAFEGKLS